MSMVLIAVWGNSLFGTILHGGPIEIERLYLTPELLRVPDCFASNKS